MRVIETAPLVAEEPPRPATEQGDALPAEAAAVGNVRFARNFQPQVARFRSVAPPGAAGALARREDPSAQLGSAVGASRDATPMPGVRPKDPYLQAGQKGYTQSLLDVIPDAAGRPLAAYASSMLKPVRLSTHTLDEKTLPELAKSWREATDGAGGITWSPSAKRTYEERAARNEAKLKQFVQDKVDEQRIVQEFNTGVPRANEMLVSLARLDAMQGMLGVKDPEQMAEKLKQSIKDAAPMAKQAQRAHGISHLKVPEAAQQVTESEVELTDAQKQVANAWRGVQIDATEQRAKDLKDKAGKDEKRLAEINEVLAVAKKVGGAIDGAVGAMGPGITLLEGQSSPADAIAADVQALKEGKDVNVRDRSSLEGAKKIGATIQSGLDIEIPTSIGGVVETAAKVYYAGEMEEIRKRLLELNAVIDVHKGIAAELGITQRLKIFERAISNFEQKAQKVQKAKSDRQLAYLQLGEQLDAAAAKSTDPGYKGAKPDAKHEHFATVMALVAAVREVLAVAAGAEKGFGSDMNSLSIDLDRIFTNRMGYGWPPEEDKAMKSVLRQRIQFQNNTGELRRILGPVDKAAGELMTYLTPGGGGSGAAGGRKADLGAY